MVVVHFSGRLAALIRLVVYASFGLLVTMRRDDAHRHTPHRASAFVYADGVLVNTLLNFAIAVTCGVQETLTLVMITLLFAILAAAAVAADKVTWNAPANSRHVSVDAGSAAAALVIWTSVLMTLNDYWTGSHLPAYIPCMAATVCVQEAFERRFVWNFFHAAVPERLKVFDPEEDSSLFGRKSNTFVVPLIETLDRADPFMVDWYDSVRNVSRLVSRALIVALFYAGTQNVKINY